MASGLSRHDFAAVLFPLAVSAADAGVVAPMEAIAPVAVIPLRNVRPRLAFVI